MGMIPRSRTARPRRTRGTSMVEMVFVLPVLLVLLFGIVEMGVLLDHALTLTNAAREGARAAVVHRRSCDPSSVEAEVRAVVEAYAASAGITLAPEEIEVNGICQPRGTATTVRVEHPHSFQVLSRLLAGLSPSLPVVGSSVMRNEGTG